MTKTKKPKAVDPKHACSRCKYSTDNTPNRNCPGRFTRGFHTIKLHLVEGDHKRAVKRLACVRREQVNCDEISEIIFEMEKQWAGLVHTTYRKEYYLAKMVRKLPEGFDSWSQFREFNGINSGKYCIMYE
jgi:hypothetical protein